MRAMMLTAFIALTTLALGGCTSAARVPLSLKAIAPHTNAQPLEGTRGSLVALVFISHECPIANAMMPDIVSVATEAHARGIAFFAVHPASWPTDHALTDRRRAFHSRSRRLHRTPTRNLSKERAEVWSRSCLSRMNARLPMR